jgi:type I restriction enzyme S subunit
MDFDCVRIKTERFLSEEGRETQKNLLLLKSTVCFTCIGATIGKICMTGRESFTNQQINSVIVNPQRHDPYFAYSLLRTLRNEIVGIAGGAATPIVNKTAFSNFPIIVPPLPAQRKIASILSAYDDLIENNTRRIAILEEMAQAIYRERFVNFRFPGHEKVKMVDSPLGKIPEGWEVVNVEDAVFINPRTTVPREGEKPFVSMGAVPHNTMLIDESEIEMRTGNSGSKFKNGDTLFARITPCLENGKTAFVQFLPSDRDVAFGSTEFIVLRSRTVCPEYVYLMARLDEFRGNAIKSMSGATGRQRVQEDCFKKYFIAQPESKVMELFALLMGPLFKHVFTLANKNENLCTTRDLLLPKLISGQIDVEDLDITVDESPVEDAT